MSKKEFEPLIKTTTLQNREVDVKDTMNFDRDTGIKPKKKKATKAADKEMKKRDEKRKNTMKTQKMSLDVILKLDILDPFLRSTENIQHDNKISINNKIDILINSYINSKLSTRQLEGFKAIYEGYIEEE